MWSQLARGGSSASRERTPLSQGGSNHGPVRQLRRRSDHKPPLSASLLVGIQDYTTGYKPNRQGLALPGRAPSNTERIPSLSSFPNAARPESTPSYRRPPPAPRPLARLVPRDTETARDVGASALGGLLGDYEDEVVYDEEGGELHPAPSQALQDYDAYEDPLDYDDIQPEEEEQEEVPLAIPVRVKSKKGQLASAALLSSLEDDISPPPALGSSQTNDDELLPFSSFVSAKPSGRSGRAVVFPSGAPATPEASDDSRDSFALGFPSAAGKQNVFARLSAAGASRGVVRPRSPSLDNDDGCD